MPGFVGEMCPAILHLRDARIRIVRMRPILIAALLWSLPIEPGQIGAGGVSMPEACASFLRNS
jgi:hypothetical protein